MRASMLERGSDPLVWYVYMIECKDGSIYTGVAIDCEARYAVHAAGKGARYTRSHPPSRLLATIPAADRSTALKAEMDIKKLSPRAKRALAARHAPRAEATKLESP